MYNPQLYEVVRELYQENWTDSRTKIPIPRSSVASFPYWFFRDDNKAQERIAASALVPEHRQEAEKAIEAYYSDSHGGTLEFNLSNLVEDFLNYVIPRTAGLPDGSEHFERWYEQLDSCIFGKSCHVTVFAVLENAYDHAGRGANLLPRTEISSGLVQRDAQRRVASTISPENAQCRSTKFGRPSAQSVEAAT